MRVADVVDRALEVPIAPSFTRVGHHVRRRIDHWSPLPADLTGRTIVVTGATSGLGRATAAMLAERGAHVVVVGRDRDRTEQTARDLRAVGTVTTALADMAELEQVRDLAATLASEHAAIDALVHNAGALTATRRTNSHGIEQTVASQVLGPFLLTSLLLDLLRAARPGRVVTVSSGGMYAAGLTVQGLQMTADEYRGSDQYARAKRAQVTLNEMWAERIPAGEVVFHAMHPGWADTPGVRTALPTFRRVVGPLLRSSDEGADTIAWLATAPEPTASTGRFWLDRRERPTHKLPTTRRTDTPERRAELWAWCVEQTGADVDPSVTGG